MYLRDFQHLCQKIDELHQQNDESGKCRSKDHIHSNLQQSHAFGEVAVPDSIGSFVTPKSDAYSCVVIVHEVETQNNSRCTLSLGRKLGQDFRSFQSKHAVRHFWQFLG